VTSAPEATFFSKTFNEQIIFTIDKGRVTEALSIGVGETKRYKRVQ
jgi:hypothetical protein